MNFKKVAIIGSPGAGKTTLALKLGKKLNLPVHHLDKLYYRPGWVPIPREEWDKFQKELVKQNKWIIDGNYQRTLEIRLKEADTIIFLSFSKTQCFFRAIKRAWIYRNKIRPDRAEGCREKLEFKFFKNLSFYPKGETLNLIDKYKKGKQVFIFTHPSQVEEFLKN